MSIINTSITDTFGDVLNVSGDDDSFEIIAADGQMTDFLFNTEQARTLRDALNTFLDEDELFDVSSLSPNEAKLRVAADLGLRAKFAYRGERDYRAVERRLVPDSVYENNGVVYVSGEAYDEGGQLEGYRQFRLDRISGEVVIR